MKKQNPFRVSPEAVKAADQRRLHQLHTLLQNSRRLCAVESDQRRRAEVRCNQLQQALDAWKTRAYIALGVALCQAVGMSWLLVEVFG